MLWINRQKSMIVSNLFFLQKWYIIKQSVIYLTWNQTIDMKFMKYIQNLTSIIEKFVCYTLSDPISLSSSKSSDSYILAGQIKIDINSIKDRLLTQTVYKYQAIER